MVQEYKSCNMDLKLEEIPRREISYVGHINNFVDTFKLELNKNLNEKK